MDTTAAKAFEDRIQSMIFSVPFRTDTQMGEYVIRLVRTSTIVVRIDGKEYTAVGGKINWDGWEIPVRLETGRLDMTLPDALALELGLKEAPIRDMVLVMA